LVANSYYYDLLPDYILSDKILEIGPGNGVSQLTSRHQKRFLEADYLGIDLRTPPEDCRLRVLEGDVFEYTTSDHYGTVLAIAVVEHIPISKWPKLFKKLKSWVAPGGYLAVLVPDDERLESYVRSNDLKYYLKHYPPHVNCHVVFGITPSVLRVFMSGSKIRRIRRRLLLRQPNEPLGRSLLRFFRRVLTLHPYAWDGIMRKKELLLAIWRKDSN